MPNFRVLIPHKLVGQQLARIPVSISSPVSPFGSGLSTLCCLTTRAVSNVDVPSPLVPLGSVSGLSTLWTLRSRPSCAFDRRVSRSRSLPPERPASCGYGRPRARMREVESGCARAVSLKRGRTPRLRPLFANCLLTLSWRLCCRKWKPGCRVSLGSAVYLRFVIHKNDDDSGRRQGLFQALADLNDEGGLLPHEQRQYEEINEWFRRHLRKPRRFTRSSKPHAKNVAISWFKDTATKHITRMHELVQVLQAHGIRVEVMRTERPGYVVYEDGFQVAAEPFRETAT
jgi:hypothetical protein